jgi:hypothetical protein
MAKLATALELVTEPVALTKAELAQQKADNMIIPSLAETFMATGLSGQTAIGMALFVMFDANPTSEWVGNGSASGIPKHRTMCKEYRGRVMTQFEVGNSTVSETWQANINHPMLIDIGAVVDNGETLEINLPMIKKVYKDRKKNGFAIRIHRPEPKKASTLSGTKDSARAETANKAIKALEAVKGMLDQSADPKGPALKVQWKGPDDTSSKSARVALTESQVNKIIAGAVGILRKYAPTLLAENS